MSETGDLVKISIKRLKEFEPPEGYYLAFSGGKDSVVCKALCDLAGVKYDAHYQRTTVDPPELVYHVRSFSDVKEEGAHDAEGKPITMWSLIRKKGLPTRRRRFCCESLKEYAGEGRITITGVRWAESVARQESAGPVVVRNGAKGRTDAGSMDEETAASRVSKKGGRIYFGDDDKVRRIVEHCVLRSRVTVNPIVEWSSDAVWEFSRVERLRQCDLYWEGFCRLGCVGCPMGARKNRLLEFARWPAFERAYRRALVAHFDFRAARGLPRDREIYQSPEWYWRWWMEEDWVPGQIGLWDDEMEDEYEPL